MTLRTAFETAWRNVTEPTLMRRVIFALLIAFAASWLALLLFFMTRVSDQDFRTERLRRFGDNTLALAEKAATPGEARAAVEAATSWLRTTYQINRIPGKLHVQLLDRAGQRIFPRPEEPAPVIGATQALSDMHIDGEWSRVYRGVSGHWILLVSLPEYRKGWLFTSINKDLVFDMLIVAPIFLLPVWLAVSRGLRPLQKLSRQIARRGPDDLSPLQVDACYGELKPLAGAIEQLLVQLNRKIQRERAFVQDAAHELRTPMAVISAQAHTLACAPDGPQREAAERHMEQAIARASHLVQQLLDLARIDNAAPGSAALLDVAQLLRDELAQSAPAAMARQLELSLEAPDALPAVLETHALRSIVQNLLTNALRYVQAGGQVAVELRRESGQLQLTVADNGPGIPADEQARVFERFYRAAGQNASGSGLGLAIASQAAQRLGGAIELTAGIGGAGCGFVVTIPSEAAARRA